MPTFFSCLDQPWLVNKDLVDAGYRDAEEEFTEGVIFQILPALHDGNNNGEYPFNLFPGEWFRSLPEISYK